MLKVYFKCDESYDSRRTTYSEREQLRKAGIIDTLKPIEEWVKQSRLAITDMDFMSQMLYAVRYFEGAYPIDEVGIQIDQRENPDEVSKTASYFSFRDSIDEMPEGEQAEISAVLSFGMYVLTDWICSTHPRRLYDLEEMGNNPCRWWSRITRQVNRWFAEGYFKDMSEWNKTALKLMVSCANWAVRGVVFTDVSAKTIDFTLDAVKSMFDSIYNNEYYITNAKMTIENLKEHFSLKGTTAEQLKEERATALIDIRRKEREKTDEINREIQKHREYCEGMRRLREIQMEQYDKMCDKAGCALPWMF